MVPLPSGRSLCAISDSARQRRKYTRRRPTALVWSLRRIGCRRLGIRNRRKCCRIRFMRRSWTSPIHRRRFSTCLRTITPARCSMPREFTSWQRTGVRGLRRVVARMKLRGHRYSSDTINPDSATRWPKTNATASLRKVLHASNRRFRSLRPT
jgi:hypothetical protein